MASVAVRVPVAVEVKALTNDGAKINKIAGFWISRQAQEMTMTHLGNIRESDIQTAVSMADLDTACAYLQDIADIEDGGIAALAFSDANFDWTAANRGERESAIRAWLKLEAVHAAAR